MATLDAHVIALDATTGAPLWDVELADKELAYSFTLAPLAINDKVIVGTAGGDRGIRGFISALDAATGEEVWRFYTIPGPGEPGHETWEPCPPDPVTYCDPEAWMHGGASVWLTGSYDPELNLTYWGIGNPGPDFYREQRPGDNLYSDSVVALDADTGELRWYFQFTPDDPYDYDAVQIPVLADIERNGVPFKVMLWANRNGFYYVLDRATGRFLTGQPFVRVNWAEGLDDSGRPVETPQPPGEPTYPGVQGGTNWYSPSFSPRTELMYIPAWEDYGSIFIGEPQEYEPGGSFIGGPAEDVQPRARRANRAGTDARPRQHLDGRGGPRHRGGGRRPERRAAVVVRDDRRHLERHPDHGVGPAVHRRALRLLPGARRAHRRPPLAGRPRRADRQRADDPTRWAGSSTWPSSPAARSRRSRCGSGSEGEHRGRALTRDTRDPHCPTARESAGPAPGSRNTAPRRSARDRGPAFASSAVGRGSACSACYAETGATTTP